MDSGEPVEMRAKLGRKAMAFLSKLLMQAALATRPLWNRTVGWLDLMDVEGTLADGRRVWFPLSRLVSMTSHRLPEPAEGELPANPTDMPAVLHLEGGDFYVMRDSFAEWKGRIEVGRHACSKRLSQMLD